jgi:hypothetical protein
MGSMLKIAVARAKLVIRRKRSGGKILKKL